MLGRLWLSHPGTHSCGAHLMGSITDGEGLIRSRTSLMTNHDLRGRVKFLSDTVTGKSSN